MNSSQKKIQQINVSLQTAETFAVVAVSELISCSTADFSLATERALRVDATLSSPTVAGSHQTLVDVCEKNRIDSKGIHHMSPAEGLLR